MGGRNGSGERAPVAAFIVLGVVESKSPLLPPDSARLAAEGWDNSMGVGGSKTGGAGAGAGAGAAGAGAEAVAGAGAGKIESRLALLATALFPVVVGGVSGGAE